MVVFAVAIVPAVDTTQVVNLEHHVMTGQSIREKKERKQKANHFESSCLGAKELSRIIKEMVSRIAQPEILESKANDAVRIHAHPTRAHL